MTEEHYTKYRWGLNRHTDPAWGHKEDYYTHPDGSLIQRYLTIGMWVLLREGEIVDICKYRHTLMEKYFSAP
jgi:hypothetical protein